MQRERGSSDRRGSTRAAIGAIALVAALGGRAAPARADDVEAAAQVHLDRGIAAYGAADYATAQAEFASASALVPQKANPFRWLALTEIQLGDCMLAAADVDSFVARVPADDGRVPELERARDACRPRDPAVAAATHVVEQSRPAPGPPPPVGHRSIVTRPWFWIVVGGVAAAAIGVVVIATAGDGGGEVTLLPPITCTATGCARGPR